MTHYAPSAPASAFPSPVSGGAPGVVVSSAVGIVGGTVDIGASVAVEATVLVVTGFPENSDDYFRFILKIPHILGTFLNTSTHKHVGISSLSANEITG